MKLSMSTLFGLANDSGYFEPVVSFGNTDEDTYIELPVPQPSGKFWLGWGSSTHIRIYRNGDVQRGVRLLTTGVFMSLGFYSADWAESWCHSTIDLPKESVVRLPCGYVVRVRRQKRWFRKLARIYLKAVVG